MASRKRARDSSDAAVERVMKKIDRSMAKRGVEATVARYHRPSTFKPETKYFDTSFSQTVASAADWTGTEVPCTNYIQSDGTTVGAYTDSALIPSAIGSGFGQVVGSKYKLRHLMVRGECVPTVASDQADMICPPSIRLVLVQDNQPNGAQAQGEDVFPDMGTNQQNNYSFLAMGTGAGGRFRILAERLLVLKGPVAGTDGASTNSFISQRASFSISVPVKSQVSLKTNSATPTVASLISHNIFLLAHRGDGVAVTLTGVARCTYVD